jgi:hypothetical protein
MCTIRQDIKLMISDEELCDLTEKQNKTYDNSLSKFFAV